MPTMIILLLAVLSMLTAKMDTGVNLPPMPNSIHELSNAGDDLLMADWLDQHRRLRPRLQHAGVGISGIKEERHSMM